MTSRTESAGKRVPFQQRPGAAWWAAGWAEIETGTRPGRAQWVGPFKGSPGAQCGAVLLPVDPQLLEPGTQWALEAGAKRMVDPLAWGYTFSQAQWRWASPIRETLSPSHLSGEGAAGGLGKGRAGEGRVWLRRGPQEASGKPVGQVWT